MDRYAAQGMRYESKMERLLPSKSHTTSMLDTHEATAAADQNTKMAVPNRAKKGGSLSSFGVVASEAPAAAPSDAGASTSFALPQLPLTSKGSVKSLVGSDDGVASCCRCRCCCCRGLCLAKQGRKERLFGMQRRTISRAGRRKKMCE